MVTGSDGKIMEYTAPLLVRDLLATCPQHLVVHSEDATCRSLSPDQKLIPGHLYRLLHSPPFFKDAVFSEARSIDNGRFEGTVSSERRASTRPPSSVKCVQNGGGVIRVKMVISKRELEALLSYRSLKEKSLLPQEDAAVRQTSVKPSTSNKIMFPQEDAATMDGGHRYRAFRR